MSLMGVFIVGGLLISGSVKQEVFPEFTVDEIQKQYKKVQGSIVELSTGEIKDTFDFENFDARKAAKDSKLNHTKLGDAIPDGYIENIMPLLKGKL